MEFICLSVLFMLLVFHTTIANKLVIGFILTYTYVTFFFLLLFSFLLVLVSILIYLIFFNSAIALWRMIVKKKNQQKMGQTTSEMYTIILKLEDDVFFLQIMIFLIHLRKPRIKLWHECVQYFLLLVRRILGFFWTLGLIFNMCQVKVDAKLDGWFLFCSIYAPVIQYYY